nr:SET domain-containing protein-lysine N-methyltransferase [Chlorobium ferrooxidans]
MDLNSPLLTALLFSAGMFSGFLISRYFNKRGKQSMKHNVTIAASSVSGRGAFASNKIMNGAVIERCPALEVTDKDIGGELLNYVFYGSRENSRLVVMGNGMLFNHSFTPNVAYYLEQTDIGHELILYALRDIEKGEELFYNYGDEWWATRQG